MNNAAPTAASAPVLARPVAMLLLVLANALWGTSYVITKVALEELPPPLLIALRFTLAGALFWVVLSGWRLARPRGTWPTLPTAGDAARLGLLGLLGIAGGSLFFYVGIDLTTATDASLMIVGEVIFTTLLAAVLVGDRLGRARIVGVVVGIVGVVVLIGSTVQEAGERTGLQRALGDGLILVGLLLEAFYTVFGAGLARRYHPLVVLTYATTGSLLVWLPLLVWFAATGSWPSASVAGWGGVLYLAVVSSLLCYLIWFSVLRVAGPSFGAISLLAQPLVGAVLGVLVLHDPVGLGTVVGGACVLLALALTAWPTVQPTA